MKLWFNKSKNDVKAVYDANIVSYLKSIGFYDKIIRGEQLCLFCGNKITIENLEIIIPKDNKINFVCNNKKCLSQL